MNLDKLQTQSVNRMKRRDDVKRMKDDRRKAQLKAQRLKLREIEKDKRKLERAARWENVSKNIISDRWDLVRSKHFMFGDYFTCIYVIQEEGGGYVKIGMSKLGTARRLRYLRTGNARDCVAIYSIINVPVPEEAAIHKEFSEYAVNREWFLPEILSCKAFINRVNSYNTEDSFVINHYRP